MPVVEEKVDAVLFGLDRVIDRTGSVNRQLFDGELISTGRARVGAHLTLDLDRCLLGKLAETLPTLGGYSGLDEHCLQQAGAVAHYDKRNFSG